VTRSKDVGLVLLASLAFATASPLGKVAGSVPAITVACARTGIAALILAVVLRGSLVDAIRALSNKHRLVVVVAGALLAAHFALFLAGLNATSLAAAVALVSLEPLAVVIAARIAFGIEPTRREWVGVILATAGAAVVASGAGQGEHHLTGDLLVVACVLLYGVYVAAARGLRDAMPWPSYAASVYGTSSLLLLPFAFLVGSPAPSREALGAVVGLGLIPTLIGHTAVQIAARRASPALVALSSPGETIGSIAIGAALMHAAPSVREGIGAVIVVAGATLAVTSRNRES
jgi:drug/metabolite transporter (DMT)-like permease